MFIFIDILKQEEFIKESKVGNTDQQSLSKFLQDYERAASHLEQYNIYLALVSTNTRR